MSLASFGRALVLAKAVQAGAATLGGATGAPALQSAHPRAFNDPLAPPRPTPACSALERGAAQLAAGCPGAHPLLPTTPAGLVVVACTAKGRQLHRRLGVDSAAIHAGSGGVRDCVWVAGRAGGQTHAAAGTAAEPAMPRVMTAPAPLPALQLPMAGGFLDGEIGPEILDARSALHWRGAAGAAAGARIGAAEAEAARQRGCRLQGFTTILTALGAAP